MNIIGIIILGVFTGVALADIYLYSKNKARRRLISELALQWLLKIEIPAAEHRKRMMWHSGIDISPPPENTPVFAAYDGIVNVRSDASILLVPDDKQREGTCYLNVVTSVKDIQHVNKGDVIGYITDAPLHMIRMKQPNDIFPIEFSNRRYTENLNTKDIPLNWDISQGRNTNE